MKKITFIRFFSLLLLLFFTTVGFSNIIHTNPIPRNSITDLIIVNSTTCKAEIKGVNLENSDDYRYPPVIQKKPYHFIKMVFFNIKDYQNSYILFENLNINIKKLIYFLKLNNSTN